jgi:hypothetical protein
MSLRSSRGTSVTNSLFSAMTYQELFLRLRGGPEPIGDIMTTWLRGILLTRVGGELVVICNSNWSGRPEELERGSAVVIHYLPTV